MIFCGSSTTLNPMLNLEACCSHCCRVVTIRAVVTFMNRTDISGTLLAFATLLRFKKSKQTDGIMKQACFDEVSRVHVLLHLT